MDSIPQVTGLSQFAADPSGRLKPAWEADVLPLNYIGAVAQKG
jgi:hypothetical protein